MPAEQRSSRSSGKPEPKPSNRGGGPGRPAGRVGGRGAQPAPEIRQYALEMQEMLRQRDPQVYRDFIRKWRDLHQRGAVDQLLTMDDAALRLRLEHMILSAPALADLHPSAREYLAEHGETV